MFNWSLRNKLTLATSVAVVTVAFIVAAVGFIESKKSMEADVQSRVENSATSYANYVSNWFTYKGEALKAMPENTPRLMMYSNLKIIRDAGNFENVFLAYDNGVQNNANNVDLPTDNNDPRKWGWYINALKDKSTVYIDNPSIAAATNQVVVSLGKAMMLQGDTQVVLGADVNLKELNKALTSYHLPGNSSIALISASNKIVTSENPQLINRDIRQLGFADLNTSSESVVQQEMQVNGQAFQVYVFPVPNTNFKVMVSLDEHSLIAPLYDIAINQLLLALGVVVVMLLLNVILINKLLKPLVKVTQSLKEISRGGGDLTQRIQVLNNDEIGQLSRSFNEFIESQRTLISHVVDQTESLQVVAKDSYKRSDLVNQVLSVQQDEVTMVATSIEQLSCSTGEIAANADLAANSAQQSSLMADKGVLTVENSINSINDLSNEIQQTYNVIGELSNHVQNIDSILVAIQTVAEQTNLLALNAAIEAARAGEQGRGFAVVADEVRVLSQRTHQSTEEIQRTIETLRSTMSKATTHMESSASLVESSVEGSSQVAQAFEEINLSITTISDMSTQIAAAVEEQTTVTRDVSSYVASIKNEADKLALNAQENIKQAEELTAQSDSLHSKVATFTV